MAITTQLHHILINGLIEVELRLVKNTLYCYTVVYIEIQRSSDLKPKFHYLHVFQQRMYTGTA